jgi:hypothetical protein
MSVPTIGALLGHRHASTTNRYAHLDEDPLKHANETIGDRIHAAMSGKKKAPLVPFRITRRKGKS